MAEVFTTACNSLMYKQINCLKNNGSAQHMKLNLSYNIGTEKPITDEILQ
jgi:hypothetical protein